MPAIRTLADVSLPPGVGLFAGLGLGTCGPVATGDGARG
jgi:hypothetical protein